ncbi:MAG: ATP synthase F1 subunit delta [Pirellulaceae bacterium]
MSEAAEIPTVLDSTSQKIGEAYARALLAQPGANSDQLVESLGEFGSVLKQLPKLQGMLESPKVDISSKESVLDKCLNGKVEKVVLNFVKLLARKGRFDCYSAIYSAAVAIQDEVAGRVRAVVTSAAELSDDSRQKLEQKLSDMLGKQVLVSVKIDPSIIGGVVVRVGDTVYDSSVANRLNQVKAKAIKGVTAAIRESFARFSVDA